MPEFQFNPFRQDSYVWTDAERAELSHPDVGPVHRSLAEYRPTPLVRLPGLARRLGVGQIIVKDESHRFGLKAFKALGATYAIYRFIREQTKSAMPPEDFHRDCPVEPGRFTFCTATDGNHGRGVAWAAARLKQKAVIFMPAGSADARVEAIRNEGAEVRVIDGNYDEAVRICASEAKRNGWQVISDTSWDGYHRIPLWIAAGYSTLFREIDDALEPGERIDLALVPSGVGALAQAAAWHFRGRHVNHHVKLVSVEPVEAACMLESIRTPDGRAVTCRGRLDSIMAGLNCGTPSPLAWPCVRGCYELFLAVEDDFSERAMRTYFDPVEDDPRIISGESGAATLAALLALTDKSTPDTLRRRLNLGPESTVLLLNTEGATDPVRFEQLVGARPV